MRAACVPQNFDGSSAPGDVVVVTHEAVLAALVSGKLSIATALDRGLLVVDGESTAVDSVRSLLNESFGEKKEKSSE